MKIKVTVYSFFFAMYVALRFLPSLFGNEFVSLLDNAFFLGALAFLALKRYKPSKFMVIASLYTVFLVIMSFINKTDRADYHLVVSNIKAVVFLYVVEWSIKEDTKRAINTLFYVLLAYTLMDFASVLLFPDGIYYKETVWNEWSTSYYAQWIFGNKNNRVYWYLCLLLAACWKEMYDESGIMRLVLAALCVISLMAAILCNSMTSLVVLCVATLGIWMGFLREKETHLHINPKFIYPGYLAFSALWISGSVTFLQGIIEGLLGRNMSFTNRTMAWGRAILNILQKPIFGWGILGEKATEILGSKVFVNAHNQLLETLWQGGICALLLFSALIVIAITSAGKISSNKKNIFFSLMITAILVEMLAESILGVDATWIYLLLYYQFANRLCEEEEELEQEEELEENQEE